MPLYILKVRIETIILEENSHYQLVVSEVIQRQSHL